MKPISPVLPHSDFPEVVYAKDQPQYLQLPACNVTYADGTKSVVTCYKMSFIERLRVLMFGKVWWEQITFGNKLQPQRPSVTEPFN